MHDLQRSRPLPLIRIENLHYRYPPFDPNDPPDSESWALAGISLDVDAGEFVGILGTTASGKSTLCLALNGLVPQQTSGTIRGDVWIGDWNTKRVSVVELATRVGLVFQDPEANFLGLTVEDEAAFGLENLAVDPAEMEERVSWALDLVGMAGHRQRFVSSLSGGQKQRVAIAAALAMLPEVLVLDDPTSELDPLGKQQVTRVISELRQRRPEMAIVMTTSDPEPVVEAAGRLIVLDAGQVVFQGGPDEFGASAEALLELGAPIPDVSELGVRLSAVTGDHYHFARIAEARKQLAAALDRAGRS